MPTRSEASKKELEECNNEISKISTCLQLFSEGDGNNMEVVSLELGIHYRTEVNIVTPDRERYAFSVLPAGYKRLFYIALDLAYRSFLLSNGTSTDITGVAIIDEIDLHLHPELEQTVLERLTKTFTHIQFVVSTHSPLVLTDIDTVTGRNKVMRMTPACDAPEECRNIYGIDYNQMLEEIMGVRKRKPEIQELFDKAWDEVAEKNTEAAKAIVDKLEAKKTPADQIELIQLRAIINRIELIGK